MCILKAVPDLLKAKGIIFSSEIETSGQVFSLFAPFAKELLKHRS